MTDADRFRTELGGYVLGGLTEDESAALEAHLARCAACRHELDELAPLPDLLDLAAGATPPAPPDLRARVLGRSDRRRRVPALVAAAVALVAALAGGVVVRLAEQPPPPDAVVALDASGPATVSGDAALVQVEAGVAVDLELQGVRPAGEGYYHAWLERDGRRASAGTFVGTLDGEVAARLLCGGRLEDYDAVTVTWHPAGGGDEVVVVQAPLPAEEVRALGRRAP